MSEQNKSTETESVSEEAKDLKVREALTVCRSQDADEACKNGVCNLNWKPARPAA